VAISFIQLSHHRTQNLQSLPTLTLERFADAKKNIEDHLENGNVNIPNGANVGVIPLGTGSAIPTKYRNGSLMNRFFLGGETLDLALLTV
jgi:hypothetical protein